jgi:hypothetical protein
VRCSTRSSRRAASGVERLVLEPVDVTPGVNREKSAQIADFVHRPPAYIEHFELPAA